MMYVLILLLISIILNVILIWYSFTATKQLFFVSENVVELHERLEEFDGHIKFIYELEMFYGDETIKNLIRHSKDLLKFMKQYRGIEEITQDQNTDMQEQDENQTEDSESEEDVSESAIKIGARGKTIFY